MVTLVLGLLSLSGLCAFLALLLEAAHAVFADYGPCRISINDGAKDLNVKGGRTPPGNAHGPRDFHSIGVRRSRKLRLMQGEGSERRRPDLAHGNTVHER